VTRIAKVAHSTRPTVARGKHELALPPNPTGRTHEVIVELIGATTTRTGLRVQAALDQGTYPLGVKVSDAELAAVPITRHDWHGEWNYTIAQAGNPTSSRNEN
jgi:hypothetical protein